MSRSKQYHSLLLLLIGTTLLSIFAIYYAYQALLNPRPALGKLFFPPSDTVFVINVLSQGVTFAVLQLSALECESLRWILAARVKGVQLTTFLCLSVATSFFGTLRLLFIKGRHSFWCLQRYITRSTLQTIVSDLTSL
jgi:hypothetical protein